MEKRPSDMISEMTTRKSMDNETQNNMKKFNDVDQTKTTNNTADQIKVHYTLQSRRGRVVCVGGIKCLNPSLTM